MREISLSGGERLTSPRFSSIYFPEGDMIFILPVGNHIYFYEDLVLLRFFKNSNEEINFSRFQFLQDCPRDIVDFLSRFICSCGELPKSHNEFFHSNNLLVLTLEGNWLYLVGKVDVVDKGISICKYIRESNKHFREFYIGTAISRGKSIDVIKWGFPDNYKDFEDKWEMQEASLNKQYAKGRNWYKYAVKEELIYKDTSDNYSSGIYIPEIDTYISLYYGEHFIFFQDIKNLRDKTVKTIDGKLYLPIIGKLSTPVFDYINNLSQLGKYKDYDFDYYDIFMNDNNWVKTNISEEMLSIQSKNDTNIWSCLSFLSQRKKNTQILLINNYPRLNIRKYGVPKNLTEFKDELEMQVASENLYASNKNWYKSSMNEEDTFGQSIGSSQEFSAIYFPEIDYLLVFDFGDHALIYGEMQKMHKNNDNPISEYVSNLDPILSKHIESTINKYENLINMHRNYYDFFNANNWARINLTPDYIVIVEANGAVISRIFPVINCIFSRNRFARNLYFAGSGSVGFTLNVRKWGIPNNVTEYKDKLEMQKMSEERKAKINFNLKKYAEDLKLKKRYYAYVSIYDFPNGVKTLVKGFALGNDSKKKIYVCAFSPEQAIQEFKRRSNKDKNEQTIMTLIKEHEDYKQYGYKNFEGKIREVKFVLDENQDVNDCNKELIQDRNRKIQDKKQIKLDLQ